MINPLLATTPELPLFKQVTAEMVTPAIEAILTDNREAVAQLLVEVREPTWENFVLPLIEMEERLHRAWSVVGHMNAVVNNPALREAYNVCVAKVSAYHAELGQDDGLFQAYQTLAASDAATKFTPGQRKTLENALRDFRLSGIALNADKRAEFRVLTQRLAQLSSQFEENVLDATDAWQWSVTVEQLQGMPEISLQAAKEAARGKGLENYLLTLDFPCFHAVMTYCDNRSVREKVYTAYVTRASDQASDGQWDNSQVMTEILSCRLQIANLLGFDNFAQQSLVAKMVKSPQQVLTFLDQLAQKAKGYAQKELATLTAFAKNKDGLDALCAWDTAYYSEALCQAEYAVSQEALRPYFPQSKVLAGMFALMQRLYGITIAEQHDFSSWHEDVRLFSVLDNKGQLQAQFYLDLYARKQKRGGAWMDECRIRHRLADGSVQLPVAFLVCNFSAPVADKPALFTHDEVVTLFHEFGHGLQHMLTQVDELPVSGINGVPWDAVELPSQFNEHWCWQKEVLPMISGHYQTGESLPEAMIDKLLAARHFQAAMQMLRQLEFAIFDMRLHQLSDLASINKQGIQELLDTVRREVAVVTVPAYNRFQHGFSHIFAGGYAAGYYSYKWAEVLASDAFARFEEEGLFNPKVGNDFLRYVLQPGGTREPLELFMEFRGREPSIDPLLRHHGMV